jgi:hypothetical protein
VSNTSAGSIGISIFSSSTLVNHNAIANSGFIGNSGSIFNRAGAVIDNFGRIDIEVDGGIGNEGTLNNAGGSINIFNEGLLDNDSVDAAINNYDGGTIDNFVGGVLANSDGAEINNNSGSIINNHVGAEVNNDGTIINNAGGEIDNAGTIDNTFGSIINKCGGTVNNGGTITGNAVVNESCDITAPSVTITSPACGATISNVATITGTASDSESGLATVEVSIDGGAFDAVDGALQVWQYTVSPALSNGPHTIVVRATDVSGNTATSPICNFTIDNIPPQTSITSATDGKGKPIPFNGQTSSTSIKFTFFGTDNNTVSGFQCKLDNGLWTTCNGTVSYSVLSKGTHNFSVRSVDGAGNTDPSPSVWTWKIVSKVIKP